MDPLKFEFKTVKKYLPEICHDAIRIGNHFECRGSCGGREEEKPICPCFGRGGGGWILSDPEKLIQEVIDFNACRERLYPMITEYKFEGLEHFRPNKFELLIEYVDSSNRSDVGEELVKLLDNGDKVGYNYDWGVGKILKEDDGTYSVESWCYGSKTISVDHGTLDEVLNYIVETQGGY